MYHPLKVVAARLSTTLDHVLGLVHSHKLKATNIGRGAKRPRWRVSEEDLKAFIAARTNGATQTTARRRKPPSPAVEYV
jgi:excisionase family DNA binding protein